jgi:hypothetical protein
MRKRAILAATVALILFPMFVVAQDVPTPTKEPLVVVEDGKYGYIDHKGEVVIRPRFLWGTDFVDGFGTVYVCGRLVSIDESGRLVPLRPANKHELRPTRRDGKVGFVDESGQFKISATFDDALPFSDGLAAVRVGGSWGFIDTKGRQVIPPRFKDAFYFVQGVGTAETGTGFVLIDKTGKVIASGFDLTHGIPADGRVPVGRDDRYGYLDLRGNVAIPLIYDDVRSFSCGSAPAKKRGKWGYIDTDGHTAIPFVFDEAGLFGGGLAPARMGNETGFIDRSGKFVFHLAFKYAPGFLTGDADGLLVADSDVSRFWTAEGTFGYVNTSGKVIWGPIAGTPDHAPILGWSEGDKTKSCEGVSPAVRELVAHFPDQ